MLAGSIALAAESDAWVSAHVMAPDGAIIPAVSVIARRSDGRVFRLEQRDVAPAGVRLPAGVYEFTMAPVGGWVPFQRARVRLSPGERVTLPLITHEVSIICDLGISPASPAVQASVRYEEWFADGKTAMIVFARKWGNEYTGHPAVLTFDRVTVVADSIRVLPDQRHIEARGNVFVHRANTLMESSEIDLDLSALARQPPH